VSGGAGVAGSALRDDDVDTVGVWRDPRLPRPLVVSVWVYFGLFVVWRVSSWGAAGTRALAVDAAFVLPGVVAVVYGSLASRRCDDARTRSAWRWLTASFVALTATFGASFGYQAAAGAVPFPSVVDACYLAFYVLFFVGLLRFPKRAESRAGRLRLWIDVTTVALGAASVIWLLVLGPTVTADGQNLVDGTIAGAYPVGDVLQIFVLAYVMTRVASRATQRVLRLLLASTLLAIIGDVTMGWMTLHAHYSLQVLVDITFMAAWMFFVLAGAAQGPAVLAPEQPDALERTDRDAVWTGRAAWLAYLAPAVVFGLLVYVQFGGSFVDRVSLTIGAAVVSVLVLTRQFLARSDLLSAQDQLSFQALHDALTGLPNRTLVLDRADRMLARARRQHAPVAALFVDVDGFKHVNDTFGHAAGDALLRAVGARLWTVVREADTVGRLGGDEFVVLLDSLTSGVSPELVAERVLDVLRQPIELEGQADRPLSIRVSVGIAIGQDETADELLRAADLALYEAKNAGKDRYVLFESNMQSVAQDRLLLEMDLHDAIEHQQLFLLYQPTFDLRSETVTGVEALLRWRHPHRGVIAPNDFIPIAEDTGMIVPIGRWVLNHACQQAAEWHNHGYPIGIAVNVSARQLDQDALLDDVEHALTASGLDPATLTLEITETTLMQSPDATAHRLRLLKNLGVRLAIDDFGTGYSSLAYLRQFPVDALKIDRSFISGIAVSKESTALIHTLVQLGKTLGLQTLGEGIEQQTQLRTLQHEDCDLGQGFLLARPLEIDAVERLLKKTITHTATHAAGVSE